MDYFDYSLIPKKCMKALNRYSEKHIKPGDFLKSVLENNLSLSVRLADDYNITILPVYVNYMYNELPMLCSGSKEKVEKWLQNGKDKKLFNDLLNSWEEETGVISSTTVIINNQYYQKIIQMGKKAIPFIIEELKENRNPDLMYALRVITGENPVPPESRGKVKEMISKWLELAKEKGW